jgi:hypothetical protein
VVSRSYIEERVRADASSILRYAMSAARSASRAVRFVMMSNVTVLDHIAVCAKSEVRILGV